MKRLSVSLTVFGLCAFLIVPAHARSGTSRSSSLIQPASIDNTSYIGVNTLKMLVSNVGSFAYDPSQRFGKPDGLYFPRGTNKSVIFAAGLWVGAVVNGAPRVTVAEHSTEYSPGGMADGTYIPDRGGFHVYKINRGDDAGSNPDYANWPFDEGAPALQNAAGEDSLDAQGNRIPLILGDQALWAVYNDARVAQHTNSAGATDPLGIEVQQYTFAYARSAALGNTIYLKFKIINKGANTLEDTYISLWSDPDVGDAFDDLVGCDTVLSLGYAYNEGPDDVYGETAPAVGFDFLQGPIVPSPGDSALQFGAYVQGFRNLPMTSFNKYINGTDPQNAGASYNYMRGLTPEGGPLVNPITGEETFFQMSGDPVTGDGWIDVSSSDRRMMMSSGPFTMAPGDTQEVVAAVLVGQGADHLSSISALKSIDEQVQAVFDLNFEIPFPPPSPEVWSQPLPGGIELIWGTEAEGDVQESEILGQRFVMEGYNVYQGESQTGPWKKIATFDVDNDVTFIYSDRFDSDIGAVQRIVAQSGSNSGLANHLTIQTDRYTGRALISHRPYYFAVTAYAYDENNMEEFLVGANVVGHIIENLETRTEGMETIPGSVAVELVDTAAHASGTSDGAVIIRVLEPEILSSAEYLVSFNDDLSWNLDNQTTGARLLADQTNESGDYTYAVVEGIMVQVTGPPPGIKQAVWEGPEEPWVTSVYWGGRYFNGGLEMGAYFFGSSILDETELVSVEIRFSPTTTQRAYAYIRGDDPSYRYGGWGTVPFTVWDVSSNPARQLNVCFVEQFGLSSANLAWLPPDGDELGAREYVFILNSDYSDTPDSYYTERNILIDGGEFDVLYAWWPTVAAGHSNAELADGQILKVDINAYNRVEDRFTFRTYQAGDEPLVAAAALDAVHPVPNPYFHRTDLEADARHRQIKFVNLPSGEATLEIYNLSGELVRSVAKDNVVDAFVVWDVLTERGLPPASGLYIYRIIVPGVGTRVGKLALFTEEERLEQF